jgi:hypothetical protein
MRSSLCLCLCLCPAPAVADEHGVCTATICPDGTKVNNCDPCNCPGECSGSSSGGRGGGGPNAFTQAIVAIGTGIYYTFGILLAPGHMAEKVSHLDDEAASAEAAQEFDNYQRGMSMLQSEGHDLAAASDSLRDAVASAPPPTPKLRGAATAAAAAPPPYNGPVAPGCPKAAQYACDTAAMLYDDALYAALGSGPIGPFGSEQQMITCCAPLFPGFKAETPPAANGTCPAGNFTNVGLDNIIHCCPNGFPWLNSLDGNCYEEADFRGARPGARHGKGIGPTELKKP